MALRARNILCGFIITVLILLVSHNHTTGLFKDVVSSFTTSSFSITSLLITFRFFSQGRPISSFIEVANRPKEWTSEALFSLLSPLTPSISAHGLEPGTKAGEDDRRDGGSKKPRRTNVYIQSLLTCPHTMNENTAHVRIPDTRINHIDFHEIFIQDDTSSNEVEKRNEGQDIRKRRDEDEEQYGPLSSSSSNDEEKQKSERQYFNPAILTLPFGSMCRHSDQNQDKQRECQYLVFSRLVTKGTHQATHFCPAILEENYRYDHNGKKDDAESSEEERVKLTLRCVSPSQRLSIPSTPAYRCSGRWATFADIPGFHDPRVFWSGKGEPLVLVNSASAAPPNGCVGLWIVDLRTLIPELEGWVADGGKKLRYDSDMTATTTSEDTAEKRMNGDNDEKQTFVGVGVKPKMSYPFLTEIMKNPMWTRSPVEKNWILFFPKEEESWVMYDVLAQQNSRSEAPQSGKQSKEDEHDGKESALSTPWSAVDATEQAMTTTMMTTSSSNNDISSNATGSIDHEAVDIHISLQDPHTLLSLRGEPEVKDFVATTGNTSKQNQSNPSQLLKRNGNETASNSNSDADPDTEIHPSRTLAKLIGAGYTTPNLTSPDESACFDTSHVHDILGNVGKWHQGSNSLRLVLCHRLQHQQKQQQQHHHAPEQSDSSNDLSLKDSTTAKVKSSCTLTDSNEAALVQKGQVVHFAVMHRKFSNSLDLPMRYERYFMVWEARWPFRVVGISKYPVLFQGERAQPWSEEENGLSDDVDGVEDDDDNNNGTSRKGDGKWNRAYFTYTPSLAWAWRRRTWMGTETTTDMEASDDEFHHPESSKNLGTGYLDDDVIVGIGMDDVRHGFVKVGVERLLSCLRLCPDFETE